MGSHPRTRVLTEDQLRALPTPRLLAYKNRLLRCREKPSEDNAWPPDREPAASRPWELTKMHLLWQQTYVLVKRLLVGRKHVHRPRKVV